VFLRALCGRAKIQMSENTFDIYMIKQLFS
jgi:hypothetical protein